MVPESPGRPKFYAAVAVQFAVLVAMILQSFSILASGREIRLKVIPRDPRSLISGDYVILNFEPSSVTAVLESGTRFAPGDPVFVRLLPGEAGLWQAAGASPQAFDDGGVQLAGTVKEAWDGAPGTQRLQVAYGIEQWYVPEGTGGEVERRAREGTLVVVAAVTGDGRAALKRLEP